MKITKHIPLNVISYQKVDNILASVCRNTTYSFPVINIFFALKLVKWVVIIRDAGPDARISCLLSVIGRDSGIFHYLYLYPARDIFTVCICIRPAKS